jgi:hypothetical protein
MKPNSSQAAARSRRSRIDRYNSPPSRGEVVSRPFLYLLVAAIWAALFLVVVGLYLALPLALSTSGSPTMADRWTDMSASPATAVIELIVLAVILVPIFGYVLMALPMATFPLVMLALTYVVRSLQRRYAGERLSATGYSKEAIGPVRVTPAALSLIPLHMTGWTRFWMYIYMMGWVPSRRLFWASLPWGLAYLVTVIWVLWPVAGIGWPIWCVVTAALVAVALVLLARDVRARYPRS